MGQKKDKDFCELGANTEMNCFYFNCSKLSTCSFRKKLYHKNNDEAKDG